MADTNLAEQKDLVEHKKDIAGTLEKALSALKGTDYIECETLERRNGNISPMIMFSSGFQCRLAAMALGTNPGDVEDLPLSKFNAIITATNNFLLKSLGDEETVSES